MALSITITETAEDTDALADLLEHIAKGLREGYTSGYHPGWEVDHSSTRPVANPEMTYHVEDNITGRHASRGGSFAAAVGACAALNSEPAGRGGRYGVYDRDGIRRHDPITTTEGK